MYRLAILLPVLLSACVMSDDASYATEARIKEQAVTQTQVRFLRHRTTFHPTFVRPSPAMPGRQ